MTHLEIAKAIRYNAYNCREFTCGICPFSCAPCGNSSKERQGHSTRIKLVDDYIAKHEKENDMTEIDELEKAYKEMGEKLEALKKAEGSKKVPKYDYTKLYCTRSWGFRLILLENPNIRNSRWYTLDNSAIGVGFYSSAEEAFKDVIKEGYTILTFNNKKDALTWMMEE